MQAPNFTVGCGHGNFDEPMPGGGAHSADGPGATGGAAVPARPNPLARAMTALRHLILLSIGLGMLALALGFMWFMARVPAEDAGLDRKAEGIVVLTGGAARINDAIELLAAERGHRLLITGVNPTTHTAELARLTPQYRRLFDCCIDLDRSAMNTIGNAVETRRWARARGFHSLLVVTSAYHMPRAIAELSHELPDVMLIEFPVLTERQRTNPWWTDGATARLVISEYLKFVYTVVRIHVAPMREPAEVARGCCTAG
jgi:uncharacterized SAM-binding protein YcdF (DUF218 family)